MKQTLPGLAVASVGGDGGVAAGVGAVQYVVAKNSRERRTCDTEKFGNHEERGKNQGGIIAHAHIDEFSAPKEGTRPIPTNSTPGLEPIGIGGADGVGSSVEGAAMSQSSPGPCCKAAGASMQRARDESGSCVQPHTKTTNGWILHHISRVVRCVVKAGGRTGVQLDSTGLQLRTTVT